MFDSKGFKKFIILPVLNKLHCYSSSMENLLLITAYSESELGTYLNTEDGNGIYGMSMQDHHQIWDNLLAHDGRFLNILLLEFNINPSHDLYFKLTHDLWYATAMAFFKYRSKDTQIDVLTFEGGKTKDLCTIYNEVYADKKLTKKDVDKLAKAVEPQTSYTSGE